MNQMIVKTLLWCLAAYVLAFVLVILITLIYKGRKIEMRDFVWAAFPCINILMLVLGLSLIVEDAFNALGDVIIKLLQRNRQDKEIIQKQNK